MIEGSARCHGCTDIRRFLLEGGDFEQFLPHCLDILTTLGHPSEVHTLGKIFAFDIDPLRGPEVPENWPLPKMSCVSDTVVPPLSSVMSRLQGDISLVIRISTITENFGHIMGHIKKAF